MSEVDSEFLFDAMHTLKAAADELESGIENKFPEDLRDQYPLYVKKYELEMSLPEECRELAERLELFLKYGRAI